MSGTAVVGGFENTGGLMPRHLRRQEPEDVATVPAAAPDREPADNSYARDASRSLRGMSETDELRRRIAAAAVPSRRGPKPIWVGLGVVALLALGGALFPDAIAALMPAVDAAP